jgi:hypothetical protein
MSRSFALLFMLLASCLLLLPPCPAAAQAVEEFDEGFGLWKTSPRRIGRSKNPGWQTVTNSGEQAAKTNPTGSKVTYYWKLSQVFDMSEISSPLLTVKYDFRGHNYSYFRVQIGDQDARRLADFTTLHEDNEASGVQTIELDLSAYEGDKHTVRLLLRKPSAVVEKRIGLYVHQVTLSAQSPVSNVDCTPYDRDLFRHWRDADSDCQDARQESLIESSSGEIIWLDSRECRVGAGRWQDPYTNLTFDNPTHLDIDHMVPLKEAYESGAWAWTDDQRRDFANQLEPSGQLWAVQASANRRKGARDPAEWLPSNESFHGDYARAWIAVKAQWGLTMDAAEKAALIAIVGDDDSLVWPEDGEEFTCSN